MKVCGIVVEYNPFHKGHQYQIEYARKNTNCDVLVVVMSGNFVQRGEPAIIDKFHRAVTACKNGVDLVLELPYIYATQSANHFAKGAIDILKLANIDTLCFGSECANLENLKEIAQTSVNPDHLHQTMDTGMSFPKAYSLLTTSMGPNDILGVSYLKQIENTNIKPLLVQRTSNYLDTNLAPTASALAIRTALKNTVSISEQTAMSDILETSFYPWMERYYPYLRTLLLTSRKETLQNIFLVSEGIENHIVEQAKVSATYEEFLNRCVNYRYTANRIRRICLQIMNQITKEEVKKLPPLDTFRVLAFNSKGKEYLHHLKKQGVRYCSRFASVPYPYRKMEYTSTLVYTSVMEEPLRQSILKKEIEGAIFVK